MCLSACRLVWHYRFVASRFEHTARVTLSLSAPLLQHLVSSLDGGKDGSKNAAALIASIRALTTLVPRCTRAQLLGELARGRLMEGVRHAFLSTSLDLRRAVVALLVALHGVTSAGGAFARYTEAYLTPPQLKLLSIYIDKAASGVAAPV